MADSSSGFKGLWYGKRHHKAFTFLAHIPDGSRACVRSEDSLHGVRTVRGKYTNPRPLDRLSEERTVQKMRLHRRLQRGCQAPYHRTYCVVGRLFTGTWMASAWSGVAQGVVQQVDQYLVQVSGIKTNHQVVCQQLQGQLLLRKFCCAHSLQMRRVVSAKGMFGTNVSPSAGWMRATLRMSLTIFQALGVLVHHPVRCLSRGSPSSSSKAFAWAIADKGLRISCATAVESRPHAGHLRAKAGLDFALVLQEQHAQTLSKAAGQAGLTCN